jgi:hypothetical protein
MLSIRKFTRDNRCSIEFDAFGFSVKDLTTRREILHCNSDGNLYTFPGTPLRLAPPLPCSPPHLLICGTNVSVTPVKMPCLHFSVYLSSSVIKCSVHPFVTLVSLASMFRCHLVCLLLQLASCSS